MSLEYRPRKGPICNSLAFQDFVDPPIAGEFVRSLCEEDTSQKWRVPLRHFPRPPTSPVPPSGADRMCNTSKQQHTRTYPGVAAFLHGGVYPHPLIFTRGSPPPRKAALSLKPIPIPDLTQRGFQAFVPPAVCSVVAPLIPGSGVPFPPPASPSTFTVHLTDLPHRLGGCGAPEDARRHSMRRACRRRGHGSRAVPAFSSVRTS